MTDCKVCWGTGFYHGLGAPCKEGCKPPAKKHGLAAVTNSDAASESTPAAEGGPIPGLWSTLPQRTFGSSRPHQTTVEECREAVKEDWSTSLDLGFRPYTQAVDDARKAYQAGAKKFYQSDTTAEECREAVKKFMQTQDPETGED